MFIIITHLIEVFFPAMIATTFSEDTFYLLDGWTALIAYLDSQWMAAEEKNIMVLLNRFCDNTRKTMHNELEKAQIAGKAKLDSIKKRKGEVNVKINLMKQQCDSIQAKMHRLDLKDDHTSMAWEKQFLDFATAKKSEQVQLLREIEKEEMEHRESLKVQDELGRRIKAIGLEKQKGKEFLDLYKKSDFIPMDAKMVVGLVVATLALCPENPKVPIRQTMTHDTAKNLCSFMRKSGAIAFAPILEYHLL